MHPIPPKDIQVLIRKGDHTGINSLITNISLQQFRQMIGLQYSSGPTTSHDRRTSAASRTSDTRRPYSSGNPNHQPVSSSSLSSSSSSLPLPNARLINALKQRSQETVYFANNDRQHLPMSSRRLLSLRETFASHSYCRRCVVHELSWC